MKQRVGIVGVGIMGSAMGENLIQEGFALTCCDVDDEHAAALVRRGAARAASPAEVATASDAVIVSLPTVAALEDVSRGLADGAHGELVVVETSTLPLSAKVAAWERLAEVGTPLLDAPISGTGKQARDRDIVFYASGDRTAFDRTAALLGAMSRAVHYLGEFGVGSKMKFVANLLVAVHNLATAEAMLLARAAGLDPAVTLQVISEGAGNSRILELRGPLMVEGEYLPATATIDTIRKDVAIIGDFAAELSCPTPLLSACMPYYAAAAAQGWGHHDSASLLAVLEDLAATPRPA